MMIPVFVSCSTVLNDEQEASRDLIDTELTRLGLEARSLGRSDYPTELPLREVITLARHCAGAVILGFEQFRADTGVWNPGTSNENPIDVPASMPTPWNHLESAILATLRVPMIVFKQPGIAGGVFDPGVSESFVHPMPIAPLIEKDADSLQAVFMKWQSNVRDFYYR